MFKIFTIRACGLVIISVGLCLSLYLSVCLSVCSGYNFWTNEAKNFIFSIKIHFDHIQVKFEYQGHWVKVKWKPDIFYLPVTSVCLYACMPLKLSKKVKVIWRSRSVLRNIKVKWKEINFLSICKCFCDLCVTRMVRLRLKGILVENKSVPKTAHKLLVRLEKIAKICDQSTYSPLRSIALVHQ